MKKFCVFHRDDVAAGPIVYIDADSVDEVFEELVKEAVCEENTGWEHRYIVFESIGMWTVEGEWKVQRA